LRKLIPPPFEDPSPLASYEIGIVFLVFAQKEWPIEIKYVDKRIVIEDVDRNRIRAVVHEKCDKHDRKTKRTSAVGRLGTGHLLLPGRFFEGRR
jgi:hypothetical protein